MSSFRRLVLALVLSLVAGGLPAAERTLVIATGPVTGTYFPAGGAICRVVNEAAVGLTCLVKVTEGSGENIAALRDGTADLAIVQSDWQYHAFQGSANGGAPAFAGLRSLLSLQPQVMTLVAGSASGVLTLPDLAGKRIAVGPAGSGVKDAAEVYLSTLGLDGSFTPVEMPLERLLSSLCEGTVDAFLLPTAHPNGAVREAIERCGARLVDLQGPATETLVETWPFYVAATIPAGTYSGLAGDLSSYGIVATLVATDRLSDADAYAVTAALIEGLEDLKTQYPALADLQVERMVGDGATAPTHPGAQRFFDERQLR